MTRLPPLNAIAYFEAVARHGGVTTAARELLVSPSAVSQQIRSLEETLGVRLFRRANRRLIPTADGEHLYASASEALELIRQARRRIERKCERWRLTVRVAPSLGDSWLSSRLVRFILDNPEIDLHVDATPEITDFETENVDLDIRYGAGDWPGLFVEALTTDVFLPVARPDHPIFESNGDIRGRLQQARLIHSIKSRVQWADWLTHNGLEPDIAREGLRFDRSYMSLHIAEQGVGVALENTTYLLGSLSDRRLLPVFPEARRIALPAHWIVCPNRNLHRRPVATFRNWLLREAETHNHQVEAYFTRLSRHVGGERATATG